MRQIKRECKEKRSLEVFAIIALVVTVIVNVFLAVYVSILTYAPETEEVVEDEVINTTSTIDYENSESVFETIANDIYIINIDDYAILAYHEVSCAMTASDGSYLAYESDIDIEFIALGQAESGALYYYIVDNSNGVYYLLTLYGEDVSIVRM